MHHRLTPHSSWSIIHVSCLSLRASIRWLANATFGDRRMPDLLTSHKESKLMRKFTPEWKASSTPRPAIWADVPDETWNDWRWQLSHRLNTLEELQRFINLTPEEVEGISAEDKFRLDITPYFASLIDPDDPLCPIRQQMIPKGRELAAFASMMADSLAEDAHSPVPGLVHRYPDRVLMLVTTQCASYCRYCTRSRIVGDASVTFSQRISTPKLSISNAPPRYGTCSSLAAIRSP